MEIRVQRKKTVMVLVESFVLNCPSQQPRHPYVPHQDTSLIQWMLVCIWLSSAGKQAADIAKV
jgi:hypothetical protein